MIKGRQKKWLEMVASSKAEIEDFNGFADDNDSAIVWADKELQNYKRAMLLLIGDHSDIIYKGCSKEEIDLIETMERRAKAQKFDEFVAKKDAKYRRNYLLPDEEK